VVNPCIPHQNKENATVCPIYVNYHLKSEIPRHFVPAIILRQYESKRTSVIKVATMEIMNSFPYKREPSHAYHKINTFHCEQRWMGHKGARALVSPLIMHCIYTALWQKVAEVISKSEKIKLITLAIVKLHMLVWRHLQLVSQSVSQSVENSVKEFFFKSVAAFFWA